MSLCKYKNALGVPGEGLHARRILGLALWDIVGTAVLALVLALWLSSKNGMLKTFLMLLAALLVTGEALHCLFCVRTPVTRFLGCV